MTIFDKTFVYDYFALKDVNIPSWSDYFFWPVTKETTTQLATDVADRYCRMAEELGDTFEGDCVIIAHHMAYGLMRILNHGLAVRRIMEKGLDIRNSPGLKMVSSLATGTPLRMRHEDIWRWANEPIRVRQGKDLLKSLRFNLGKGTLNPARHFLRSGHVFTFPNTNVIERPHVRRIADWVRITSPEEWLDRSLAQTPSQASLDVFAGLTRDLTAFSRRYARDVMGWEPTPQLLQGMEEYLHHGLTHVAEVYSAVLRRAERLKPARVLSPTGGKPLTRCVNLAVRRAGGTATGHPHGYYICHSSSPRNVLLEFAPVDEFMAYTPGSVAQLDRYMAINPIPRRKVKISHDNDPVLLDVWNTWKDRPLPKRVRTVMLLEGSLIPEWAGFNGVDAMVDYHFYYNMCRTLSRLGYRVIFKRRPKDLSWQGVNIFKDIPNLEVEYRPFEAPGVIDQADAVIIQYAMSSTLHFAMCTNRVVIYTDAGWEPWFPDTYAAMAKRCGVLHCSYDERNRSCWDEKELTQLLERTPEVPNMEYAERYLFPDPAVRNETRN